MTTALDVQRQIAELWAVLQSAQERHEEAVLHYDREAHAQKG